MNRLLRCIGFAAAVLAVPGVASAQWETANRAFHKNAVFQLEGRHLTVPCADCHVNGQIQGTPTTCFDCHWIRRQDDLYRTRLGSACEQCHRPTSWTAVRWDHATATGMPLNPAHRTMGCEGCHKNAQFAGTSIQCVACHRRDYDATRTPNHAAAGFSTACDSCHKPSDANFMQAHFTHTTFLLVGQHATQACATCHVNNVYQGTPTTCFGCHKTDYDRTTAPNHAAAGIPTTCEGCHKASDASWQQGTGFNHNQYFPLVGPHATQVCTACHKNSQYAGTPATCLGCHLADYNKTSTPNHVSAGFSTTCESCHKPTDATWMSATFNHNQFFALVGLHATQACTTCHVNGVYKGTPTDCYSCHRSRYDQTTNPNHVAAGFSTACVTCHNAADASWNQGRFAHTWFPITSGRHSGNACSACHTDPNNYATFTCLTCHAKTTMDSEHKGRSGYQYNSNFCYACHPTGRAGLVLGWEARR